MADRSLPPAVTCAEDISLLHLFHTVPVLPFSNTIDTSRIRQGSYSLSFTEERDLASILGFLSSIVDDPNHIPALCLEESTDSSLNVMLAVNKISCGDGNVLLQNLKQKLDEIFAILSEVSEGRLQAPCYLLSLTAASTRREPIYRTPYFHRNHIHVLRAYSEPVEIEAPWIQAASQSRSRRSYRRPQANGPTGLTQYAE